LVRSSIRVAGYTPEYGPPPKLGEHSRAAEAQSS
jgi:CoA:oxalate CoA-transferase